MISVALVEPKYGMNVGYIARVMKNFGFKELILIDPKFDMEEAIKFSSHASELLEKAKRLSLKELKDFDLLVGTTAIVTHSLLRSYLTPEELSARIDPKQRVCILLGRDTVGLKRDELMLCDFIVHVPSSQEYPTLNISHALAVILYELRKVKRKEARKLACSREGELIARYAKLLAMKIGMEEEEVNRVEKSLAQMAMKTGVTRNEAMIFVSLLRKACLALDRLSERVDDPKNHVSLNRNGFP